MQEDPEKSLCDFLSIYFEFDKEKDFENVKAILLEGINLLFEGNNSKDCYLEYSDLANILGDISDSYNFKKARFHTLVRIIGSELFPIIYKYLRGYCKEYEYTLIESHLTNLHKEYIIRKKIKL